jgi:hypothetical protein
MQIRKVNVHSEETLASRGRIHARLGGLKIDEVIGEEGRR